MEYQSAGTAGTCLQRNVRVDQWLHANLQRWFRTNGLLTTEIDVVTQICHALSSKRSEKFIGDLLLQCTLYCMAYTLLPKFPNMMLTLSIGNHNYSFYPRLTVMLFENILDLTKFRNSFSGWCDNDEISSRKGSSCLTLSRFVRVLHTLLSS